MACGPSASSVRSRTDRERRMSSAPISFTETAVMVGTSLRESFDPGPTRQITKAGRIRTVDPGPVPGSRWVSALEEGFGCSSLPQTSTNSPCPERVGDR